MPQSNETAQYLDFNGLSVYDSLIKGVIAAGDQANSAEIANAIEALDVETISETGKPIVSIGQNNGSITASAGTIDSRYVSVSWLGENPISRTTNVQDSLNELYNQITLGEITGEVSVWATVNGTPTQVNEITEFGKTYTFKQGNTTIATMNLAKDMVINGGSVVTATINDQAIDANVVIGEKYIKLTIANSQDILYIPVNSLYKDHTVEQNASKIQLAIDTNNVISADVVAGSIAKTDLTNAVQNQLDAKTTLTEKSTGHVTLTKTAGSGATGDNYVLEENDIASAALVGTLPSSGIEATTVIGYAEELASAAEGKATRVTVNGQSQNASTGAITVAGNHIAVNSNQSGTIAVAQTNEAINNTDKIDIAFSKILKKVADVDSDVTTLETWVANMQPIPTTGEGNTVETLFSE